MRFCLASLVFGFWARKTAAVAPQKVAMQTMSSRTAQATWWWSVWEVLAWRFERVYHDVVELIPLHVGLRDHAGGDKGGDGGANAVEAVQEAEDFVGVGHVAHPGVPAGIFKTIAETGEGQDHNEDGIRGMHDQDNVGYQMAQRAEEGNTALAVFEVDVVVQQCRGAIAYQWGEKDEGDDDICEVVVFLKLKSSDWSAWQMGSGVKAESTYGSKAP